MSAASIPDDSPYLAPTLILDFNGLDDALFHAYNEERRKFMEYVAHHGAYTDIPVDEILRAWRRAYGEDRVEEASEDAGRDFDRDTVLTE